MKYLKESFSAAAVVFNTESFILQKKYSDYIGPIELSFIIRAFTSSFVFGEYFVIL